MRSSSLLSVIALVVSILTAAAVWKMGKNIEPMVGKMGQIEQFVVSFGKPQQGSAPDSSANPSVPATNTTEAPPQQGDDPFSRGLNGLAELLHRQNENCPTTVRQPDASVLGGSLTAEVEGDGAPNLNRPIHVGQTVEDFEAIQEAARRMRSDECRPKPDPPTLSFPPNGGN